MLELSLNVRQKRLRVVEYGRWYVAADSCYLDDEDVRSIFIDTDDEVMPILNSLNGKIIHRRNPYFSSKTGKPLSKWFTI